MSAAGDASDAEAAVADLLVARRGHFALESGHHGDLWLELERLCLRPARVRALAAELAERLRAHRVEAVCGPLVEGAFVALLVAEHLGVPFTYAARSPRDPSRALYPFGYTVPGALRAEVRGRRVAIVNDVVNAGSAVLGAFEDLRACDALPVAVGTLAVLGDWSRRFAGESGIALETLASFPNRVWPPADCPLCADGRALDLAIPAG